MRLLFATDLHGRIRHLEQLLSLARRCGPHMVILGGDDLPDADPADPEGSQVRFLQTHLTPWFVQLRQACPDATIAVIAGNHDWLCTYEGFERLERDRLLRVLRPDRPLRLHGHSFFGYSCSPPSPYLAKDFERLDFPGQPYLFDGGRVWDAARRTPATVDAAAYLASAPSIESDLSRIPRVDDDAWILVAHAPPYDSDLDLLTGPMHVGSRSVRRFLLDRQPALSLHGHIHESPRLTGRFWQRFGRTIAVNPGQREDRLAAMVVEIAPETITLTPHGVEGADDRPVVLERIAEGRPV